MSNSTFFMGTAWHLLSYACLHVRSQGGNLQSGLPASISAQAQLLKPLWISGGNSPLCPFDKEIRGVDFFFFFLIAYLSQNTSAKRGLLGIARVTSKEICAGSLGRESMLSRMVAIKCTVLLSPPDLIAFPCSL